MNDEGFKLIERDIRDLEKVVYRLAESQQITTSNIDKLSADIKEIVKNAQTMDLLKQELVNVSNRCARLEATQTWGIKIIIGAFLLGVFNVVIGGEI